MGQTQSLASALCCSCITFRFRKVNLVKKRLGKFNERFQASDQDDIKKEAIQYLTDNWDSLSDADRSYFKYRIEKDNKDFINGR